MKVLGRRLKKVQIIQNLVLISEKIVVIKKGVGIRKIIAIITKEVDT